MSAPVPPSTTRPNRSFVSRFFRNPRTDDIVVAQRPNLPLGIWAVAWAIRAVFSPHGALATVLTVVGTASLGVWAVLELIRGDSPFRRVLGAVVLVFVAVGVVARLT